MSPVLFVSCHIYRYWPFFFIMVHTHIRHVDTMRCLNNEVVNCRLCSVIYENIENLKSNLNEQLILIIWMIISLDLYLSNKKIRHIFYYIGYLNDTLIFSWTNLIMKNCDFFYIYLCNPIDTWKWGSHWLWQRVANILFKIITYLALANSHSSIVFSDYFD